MPAGILDRHVGGGHGIDDELVHAPLVLRRHPVVGVEQPGFAVAARDLRRHPRRQVGDIERLDRADARFAGQQPPPYLFEADAERRHEPHAGDDNTSHAGQAPAATLTIMGPARTMRARCAGRLGTFSCAPR
jgi:hypothetical protein